MLLIRMPQQHCWLRQPSSWLHAAILPWHRKGLPEIDAVCGRFASTRSESLARAPNAAVAPTPQTACRPHASMTVWPSGLRRWLKAPFRKGVGSNPTAVKWRPAKLTDSLRRYACILHKVTDTRSPELCLLLKGSLAEWTKAGAQGAMP